MKTFEMVILADQNNKLYICDDMYYKNGIGFHDSRGHDWEAIAFDNVGGLNEFIHMEGWDEVEPRKMTLDEISEKLGYKVEIVESN